MASKLFDKALKQSSKDSKIFVSKSLDIIDRIYEIIERKGMTQKDLAKVLWKKESEISKWLSGEHNMTLKTISKIEAVLGEDIIMIPEKQLEVIGVEKDRNEVIFTFINKRKDIVSYKLNINEKHDRKIIEKLGFLAGIKDGKGFLPVELLGRKMDNLPEDLLWRKKELKLRNDEITLAEIA